MVENCAYDSALGVRGRVRAERLALGLSAGVVALATLLAGCSHLHWPWHRKPPPPPPEVHELDETSDEAPPPRFLSTGCETPLSWICRA